MAGTSPEEIVRSWIEAYAAYRDGDLIELAHPEIVLRPRRGQGEREYHGVDGIRAWLHDVGDSRPELRVVSVDELADGRVVAETLIDGVEVIALFEVRDTRILAVSVYLSDRDMLERLGILPDASQRTIR